MSTPGQSSNAAQTAKSPTPSSSNATTSNGASIPTSIGRIPEAADHNIAWIVVCDEGHSSSLAAASLQTLGLHLATDLIGGFQAWKSAGLPVIAPAEPSRPRLYQDLDITRTPPTN